MTIHIDSDQPITKELIDELRAYSHDIANADSWIPFSFRDSRVVRLRIKGDSTEFDFDIPSHRMNLEELLIDNRITLQRSQLTLADCEILYCNYLSILDRDFTELNGDQLREVVSLLLLDRPLPFREWLTEELAHRGVDLADHGTYQDTGIADSYIKGMLQADINALEAIGPVDDKLWSAISDCSMWELQRRLERIESSQMELSEDDAKRVYFSIRGHLDGLGRDPLYIVSRSEGYPFRWMLWDDGDETEEYSTISESKSEAFFEDSYLPIDPLPTFPPLSNPIGWLDEALKIDLGSYELRKVFVYAASVAVRGYFSVSPQSRLLLSSLREKLESFELSDVMDTLRLDLLEAIEQIPLVEAIGKKLR